MYNLREMYEEHLSDGTVGDFLREIEDLVCIQKFSDKLWESCHDISKKAFHLKNMREEYKKSSDNNSRELDEYDASERLKIINDLLADVAIELSTYYKNFEHQERIDEDYIYDMQDVVNHRVACTFAGIDYKEWRK